jgi:hypothetical protein
MGNIFYLIYIFIYIFLIIYSCRLTANKDLQYKFYLIILFTLFYDSFISGIGFLAGESQFLKFLNFFRYAFHVFISPLLCYIVFKISQKMGVRIAQKKGAEIAVWVLVIIFIIWGFLHDLASLNLTPSVAWGVLTYDHAEPSIPLPIIFINLFVIINSILIWKTAGWPFLFITSLAMFFIGMIQIKELGQVPGNAGEILFIYGFLLAQKKLLKLNN